MSSGLEDFGNEMVNEALGEDVTNLDVNPGYNVDTGTMVAEPPETPESPVAEEEPKTSEEPQKEPDSVFSALADEEEGDVDEDDSKEKKGLLREVAKLREERRQLRSQLESKPQNPPTGETVDVVAQIMGEDVDDNDLITVEQQRRILKAQEESLRQVVRGELQTNQQKAQSKDAVQRALASEKTARAKYKDFDKAIKAAGKARLLSREDFEEALTSADPAEVLYAKAKESLDELGSYFGMTKSDTPPPETKQEAVPADGPEEDPEKVFDEFFGT